ncbi:class I SAM-dependent methyltransferase [Thermosyntropha sp.]|uniref:tRNA (mnm(5)s(2)U34)-methyltransferase n=1 Tax=Thermosyntropha sp. TaxID=2740820 RepID=UPI0025D931A6|nr:class I SAM-dependent methyltransferase [Thermosyntropha sp.]MBO8159186.1 methyltransferase domain-containing protein [Thermosyntropha sp.]
MKRGRFKSAVDFSHFIISQWITFGDVVVDATCGRGKDTLFLANLVGDNGLVYAFDIQDEAIKSTYNLLRENSLEKRVKLIKADHKDMAKYIDGFINACIFNLGYLPGGNHEIKTEGKTSLAAVKAAIELLAPGGLIVIVGYTGHEGGTEEVGIIRDYLISLPQQKFEVLETRFINQINNPPQMMAVHKL